MRFIEPPYHAVVEQAYGFAEQHGQRVDSPHIVWAIIHAKQWPGPIPPDAEAFLQAVVATSRQDVQKSRDTTLYAQMILDRSYDVRSLLFHLFWSPWAQDQPFIQTWHHLRWAPPLQSPDNDRASTHKMPSVVGASEDDGTLRRQQRETIQKRRRERPVRIIEILRRGGAEGIDFWCTHATQYPSHSVVTGLQWCEESALGSVPQVVRLEIDTPASGEVRIWLRTRYESLADGPSQSAEYQFIGEEVFTLSAVDTLFAVTDGGQRLRLSTESYGP